MDKKQTFFRGPPLATIDIRPAVEKPPHNPDKYVGWAAAILAIILLLVLE